MRNAIASALLVLFAATAAHAATPPVPVSGSTAAYIATTEAQIAEARKSNGLKKADKDALEDSQYEIETVLEGHGDFSELAAGDRAKVEAAHGRIATLVARADADEKVCRNVATTGTRHSRRECMTKAQHQARLEASREATRDSQRMDCSVGEGNGCGMGRGGL